MTWRELAAKIREMSDEMLDKTAFVWLEDMIYRIECDGGTAGLWPIDSLSFAWGDYAVTIDEGLEEDEEE